MKFGERQQRQLRNMLMFFTALGLTIYEAVAQEGERPFLLTLYASMMGLPLILGMKGDQPPLPQPAPPPPVKKAAPRKRATPIRSEGDEEE